MALILNQVALTASTSTIVLVTTVPPNSTVTLSVPTGQQTVYVGQSGTLLNSTNGFAINPGGPQVNFYLPPSSQVVTLYAVNSSGSSTSQLCYAIASTA